MSQTQVPNTEFAVANCFFEEYGRVSVPFSGDRSVDLEKAWEEMRKSFKPWHCDQCGESGPNLNEEPLTNADLYPPVLCDCCRQNIESCCCTEECFESQEGSCAVHHSPASSSE